MIFPHSKKIETRIFENNLIFLKWYSWFIYVDSAFATAIPSDNQIRFEYDDYMSGNQMVVFTFTVDDEALCSSQPVSFKYCTGTSPTESTPTYSANSASDSSQCQAVTLETGEDSQENA